MVIKYPLAQKNRYKSVHLSALHVQVPTQSSHGAYIFICKTVHTFSIKVQNLTTYTTSAYLFYCKEGTPYVHPVTLVFGT